MFHPHPLEPRRPVLVPLLVALCAMLVGGSATARLADRYILSGWLADHAEPISTWELLRYLRRLTGDALHAVPVSLAHPMASLEVVGTSVSAALDRVDLVERARFCLLMIVISALASAIAVFVTLFLSSPARVRVRHISGRQFLVGRAARRFFTRAERRACRSTGRGLELAPGLAMARERETRHLLIQGATGSGKTVIIRHLLWQMIMRGDRVLVHDTKGDVLERLPTDQYLLLAPHDRRSARWKIATDVRSAQDAREWAAAFLPASKDPIWGAGAREILIGCIVALQKAQGRDWGWAELKDMVFSPPVRLRALLMKHCPDAAVFIELDPNTLQPTKVGYSFLVTLYAHAAATLVPLAQAWGDPEMPGLSVREWLQHDDPERRIVVMQRAAHLPALSTAWTSALVRTMARTAVGTELPDDPERRVFLVLDEFPQLGKLEGFGQLLEAGRSRGVATVLAVQDFAQLVEIYGAPTAETWQSLCGTMIIGRTGPGKTAQMICDVLIGKRRVSWKTRNTSWAGWRWDGTGGGTTRSRQWESHVIEVVDPAYLESGLGAFHHGGVPEIRALVLGVGEGDRQAVLQATWPVTNWPRRRAASEPAAWLKT